MQHESEEVASTYMDQMNIAAVVVVAVVVVAAAVVDVADVVDDVARVVPEETCHSIVGVNKQAKNQLVTAVEE